LGLDSIPFACQPRGMDSNSRSEPRFSEDRHWWWDGARWVPASQAPVQTSRSVYPRLARHLDVSNRAGWRWITLATLGVALAVAGYDLVTGWELRSTGLALVVFIGLSVFALATGITLLVSSEHERRIVTLEWPFPKACGLAAQGVRWSSMFAIGLGTLLFANCSAAVSSGNSVSGASTNLSQFWSPAALVVLPLVLAIALTGGLATAAQLLASNGRLREATRVAALGLWSAALIALAAVVATVIALTVAGSTCTFVTTASACAAGVGGLMNPPAAIGSLLLVVPYLVMLHRVLSLAPRPAG
jgi:hypothetical protein